MSVFNKTKKFLLHKEEQKEMHEDLIPCLMFPSFASTEMYNCDIGAYDEYSLEFPENWTSLCQFETRFRKSMNCTKYPPAIPSFINALRCSSSIILLSGEIDKNMLGRVLLEIGESSKYHGSTTKELRIISGNADLKEYASGKSVPDVPGNVNLIFASKLGNINKIHDRFAILDEYIWHFGAGIGGMHKTFHAISGPWLDINSSFRCFCKQFF